MRLPCGEVWGLQLGSVFPAQSPETLPQKEGTGKGRGSSFNAKATRGLTPGTVSL